MKKALTAAVLASVALAGCSSDVQKAANQEPMSRDSTGSAAVKAEEFNFSKVPKEVERYGRIIHIDKVVTELGDRIAEVSRILGEMRDLIDKGEASTLTMMEKINTLMQVVPEASRENQRILLQGKMSEKGFPDPAPAFPFGDKQKETYEKIKDLDVIPFVQYMEELAANAGMYATDLSTEQRRANMKKLRDTFDIYSRFFSENN